MKTSHTHNRVNTGLCALGLLFGLLSAGMADAATHKADFNGDGYGDLLVGVPRENINGHKNAGAVNVFYGSRNGIPSEPSQTVHLDTPKIGNQAAIIGHASGQDNFGSSVAVGDFDHDGYDDAAIGIPYADYHGKRNPGAVTILYGSASGLHGPRNEMVGLGRFKNKVQNEAYFGTALAVGDINGDQYDDLAIGIPRYDVDAGNQGTIKDAGAIAVFFGSRKGLRNSTISPHFIIQKRRSGNPDGDGDAYVKGQSDRDDMMGRVLEFADFNTDGFADLAIGIPSEDIEENGVKTNAGGVFVLHGSPKGLTKGQRFIKDQEIEPGDNFGYSLAAGDFNGDRYPDLAIGALYEDVKGKKDAGAVTIVYGTRLGLDPNNRQFWHQDSKYVPGKLEAGDFFGKILAAGDFNGDGDDDLVVGVPNEDKKRWLRPSAFSTGFVVTFIGTSQGLKPFVSFHQDTQGIVDKREQGDEFGGALSVNDFNNDGKADLVIGVPGEDFSVRGSVKKNAGIVHVLYGNRIPFLSPGKTPVSSQSKRQWAAGGGQAEAGDSFGRSLP